MPDLRLALCTSNTNDFDRVATRVRGAHVEACGEIAAVRDFDAVVCQDPSVVQPLLTRNVRVLLVAEPCPPRDVIESLFAEFGSRIVVENPDRYLPSRQLIRSQIPSAIGSPGLVRIHRWQSTASADCGGLPEPLVRDVDLALWLTNTGPNRVYALQSKDPRYVQVHFGFANGGMAIIDFDGRLPSGDGYQSLSVIGATGAAYADDHQNTQLVYNGGSPRAVRTEERTRQLAAMVQSFVDGVHANRETTSGAAEWCQVFAVTEAIRKSIDSRRAVTLEGR